VGMRRVAAAGRKEEVWWMALFYGTLKLATSCASSSQQYYDVTNLFRSAKTAASGGQNHSTPGPRNL